MRLEARAFLAASNGPDHEVKDCQKWCDGEGLCCSVYIRPKASVGIRQTWYRVTEHQEATPERFGEGIKYSCTRLPHLKSLRDVAEDARDKNQFHGSAMEWFDKNDKPLGRVFALNLPNKVNDAAAVGK